MSDIDVTSLFPDELARLSPEERARRAAVAADIMRRSRPRNAVFGGLLRSIRELFGDQNRRRRQ